MHLRHASMMRDVSEFDFFDEILYITRGDGMILLDDDVAAAVKAKPLAEGNVHIDGKRCGGSSQRRNQQTAMRSLPVRSRRMARVSWRRFVISIQEFQYVVHSRPRNAINARRVPSGAFTGLCDLQNV